MAKVKMEYNPYLMETKVRFNGREPRINSLIEKYYQYPIQMWVKHIPRILYDEMNGYDFDLDFAGTELDFHEIVAAFSEAGVSNEEVRCIYERAIEGRVDKLREIGKLNQWLKRNKNERFDFGAYQVENRDIFDDTYSIIIIGDTSLGDFDYKYTNVSEELISDIDEINNTELLDTPIIFEVEGLSVQKLQIGLSALTEKNDVREEQLFFYVRARENAEKYHKMAIDMGLKDPQIIFGLDDEKLVKYFELYPVSDYIRQYVSSLREKIDEIGTKLNTEKEASDLANKEIIEQISGIEDRINMIKESIQGLKTIGSSSLEADWYTPRENTTRNISNWKAKKTKITNDKEAQRLSDQMEEELLIRWKIFLEDTSREAITVKQSMFYECTDIFEKGSLQTIDEDVNLAKVDVDESNLHGIKEELVKIREENYEKPKENIINQILRPVSEEKEDILVVTYPCQKWREYALGVIWPMMDEVITMRTHELKEFREKIISDYLSKLEELLEERIEEKNSISNRLSEDMQRLQNDVDWVNSFKEKLEQIERG